VVDRASAHTPAIELWAGRACDRERHCRADGRHKEDIDRCGGRSRVLSATDVVCATFDERLARRVCPSAAVTLLEGDLTLLHGDEGRTRVVVPRRSVAGLEGKRSVDEVDRSLVLELSEARNVHLHLVGERAPRIHGCDNRRQGQTARENGCDDHEDARVGKASHKNPPRNSSLRVSRASPTHTVARIVAHSLVTGTLSRRGLALQLDRVGPHRRRLHVRARARCVGGRRLQLEALLGGLFGQETRDPSSHSLRMVDRLRALAHRAIFRGRS